MKYPIALFLTLAYTAFAAEPSPSAAKAVAAAEEKWKTAVLAGDSAPFDALLSPELSYTHSSAMTQTKQDFIDDIAKHKTTYKSIEFNDTKMRQYGSAMVVTHHAAITSVQSGTSNLYITEVWAQQKGQWQMVSRQATKIP